MRSLHVFFAFIMALMLMSGVYLAIWHYTVQGHAEKLPSIINKSIPGKVKYNTAEVKFHPFNPQIILKNTSIVMADPQTGGTAVAKMGDVVLDITPFGNKDISVHIPKEITMVTTHKGRSHDYRISLVEPEFELKYKENSYDVLMSLSGMVIKGRHNGYFSSFVKAGYSYISKDSGTNEWSFMLNNLDVRSIPHLKSNPIYKSVSLTWKPRVLDDFPIGYVLSGLGSKNMVMFDTMVMDILKLFSNESKLLVAEGRVAYDDIWYSYKGDIALRENVTLEANGTLTSNKFGDMLKDIESVVGTFPLALTRMMNSIGGLENKTQSIDVNVNRNMLTINGAPVGNMPEVPELLHLHGRGQR